MAIWGIWSDWTKIFLIDSLKNWGQDVKWAYFSLWKRGKQHDLKFVFYALKIGLNTTSNAIPSLQDSVQSVWMEKSQLSGKILHYSLKILHLLPCPQQMLEASKSLQEHAVWTVFLLYVFFTLGQFCWLQRNQIESGQISKQDTVKIYSPSHPKNSDACTKISSCDKKQQYRKHKVLPWQLTAETKI